jgi:hypothetical protein
MPIGQGGPGREATQGSIHESKGVVTIPDLFSGHRSVHENSEAISGLLR